MRMRYSPKPVVVAPAGMALGGGCEVTMHASRVVARLKHTLAWWNWVRVSSRRAVVRRRSCVGSINPAMRRPTPKSCPSCKRAFLQIGQAKVATSAEEARQMGILGGRDRVVMNRDHLLAEAKKEVLQLVATRLSFRLRRSKSTQPDVTYRARCASEPGPSMPVATSAITTCTLPRNWLM